MMADITEMYHLTKLFNRLKNSGMQASLYMGCEAGKALANLQVHLVTSQRYRDPNRRHHRRVEPDRHHRHTTDNHQQEDQHHHSRRKAVGPCRVRRRQRREQARALASLSADKAEEVQGNSAEQVVSPPYPPPERSEEFTVFVKVTEDASEHPPGSPPSPNPLPPFPLPNFFHPAANVGPLAPPVKVDANLDTVELPIISHPNLGARQAVAPLSHRLTSGPTLLSQGGKPLPRHQDEPSPGHDHSLRAAERVPPVVPTWPGQCQSSDVAFSWSGNLPDQEQVLKMSMEELLVFAGGGKLETDELD